MFNMFHEKLIFYLILKITFDALEGIVRVHMGVKLDSSCG